MLFFNNKDFSKIIEKDICKENKKYCFNGYYIENINNFLELNNDEILIESIPEYIIKTPIFSIIIPFVNNSKTLRKTLRSIQNQSFKFYEILLVNDQSSDNTTLVIEQLSAIDKRIKILKNKQNYGAFLSRIIGMKFSKGELIYHFDSDDMFATSNALENLYEISRISKVDTIEFNIIRGTINNYTSIMTTISSKKDRNKILYGKEIFNKRYLASYNKIEREVAGAVCSKLFIKKIKNKIINYLSGIGINNFKNWNYADDQFLTDLVKLFSDTYLYVDSIYYVYYINQESLCHQLNQKKVFVDHMKYFYYFNVLIKQFKLNDDFLICNIKQFLNFDFNVTKSDCIKLDTFIKEIKIKRITKYWKDGYKKLINSYNDFCYQFI